jgi:hypothetical protein
MILAVSRALQPEKNPIRNAQYLQIRHQALILHRCDTIGQA